MAESSFDVRYGLQKLGRLEMSPALWELPEVPCLAWTRAAQLRGE
jgi:hypothetical protein